MTKSFLVLTRAGKSSYRMVLSTTDLKELGWDDQKPVWLSVNNGQLVLFQSSDTSHSSAVLKQQEESKGVSIANTEVQDGHGSN